MRKMVKDERKNGKNKSKGVKDSERCTEKDKKKRTKVSIGGRGKTKPVG